MDRVNQKLVMRVSWLTIAVNVVLSAFKLFAGIVANSAAMVGDAAESMADIASTFVVIVGVKMAGKQADKDHPYGHERMECVTAVILAAVLIAAGLGIGWAGVSRILRGAELEAPGLLALVAAGVTIGVKELMYWLTRAAAKKTGSGSLMANAWHHRSDGLTSIATFAGILGARLGLPILDPAVCVLACLFILRIAVKVFLDAVSKMTDRACDDETAEAIRAVVMENGAVRGIDRMRTRLFGEKIYIDIEIVVDGALSLQEAHGVAEEVHSEIERRFTRVKHCMVHVHPMDERSL
ncbi:MAG: cation diffusion facilitator family transporter [Oscillospiraceae bacterium]|jgi:cation diffusion facilitator family transporter|nr:cation diffusion facilitator family transporter [Oscillospiraceae bacterium]